MWLPSINGRAGRAYQALAEAIGEAIASGTLAPGDRLPPQRDLAYGLGISVGTVGRAYALATKRGLVTGEVGRGTYVRNPDAPASHTFQFSLSPYTEHDRSRIDLRRNVPAWVGQEEGMRQALDACMRENMQGFLGYSPVGGATAHRHAGVAWLERSGIRAPAERVLVCAGASQAVATAMAAVVRQPNRDPLILCEPLVNVGFKDAAATLNITLRGVEMDDEGVCPEALARACVAGDRPAALLLVPTIQNPTTAIMSYARREAIVAVARKFGLSIIEDDLYAELLGKERPLPISHMYPEASYYVSSLSKSVAPGIRIGYLLCPDDRSGAIIRRCQLILNSFAMDVPLLMGSIASWLIESGEAARYAALQAQEIHQRQNIATSALNGHTFHNHPYALQLWLHLPPQWRTHSFAAACLERGVQIGPADDFAIGQAPVPQCVRLALGAPPDRQQLRTALNIAADLLREEPGTDIPSI